MPKPYTPNDKWSQRAASEGYRARSVYKLKELNEKFHLLGRGMKVLDLGAAPGSWMQFTSERVGPSGKVIGLDLTSIEPVADNVITAVMDITDLEKVAALLKEHGIEQVDLVLSDLAPSTSGIRDVDQYRSIELSLAAAGTARTFLKPGGRCVLKVLRGEDFDEFYRELKNTWKDVRNARVAASRDRSTEVYVILKK